MDNIRQIRTRAPALIQKEVDAACDALLARDSYPTVRKLLAELGRGSSSTITTMLDNWEQRHQAPAATPVQPSQELARVFEKEVAAAISQERAAHSDAIARLQDNSAVVVEESKQLAVQVDDLQSANDTLTDEKNVLEAKLAELTRAHESLERDDKLRVEELAQARIRLEDLPVLKNDIAQLHVQIAEERAAAAAIDKRAAVLESQRDANIDLLASERKHSAGLKEMLDTTQAEMRTMRADLEKRLADAAEAAKVAIAAERAAADDAARAARELERQDAAKTTRLEAAEALIERLQDELQRVRDGQIKPQETSKNN